MFWLTFWPGNYIGSFSYGFEVVVRDIGEWRPGFYTEFRYKSYEHSGLAWEAIFKKQKQAKPKWSQDARQNSGKNPDLHSPRSLTTTSKPYENLRI